MSHVLNTAADALNAKLGEGFSGLAKFVISGEGGIIVDTEGARVSDDPADVTLTADAETFTAMLGGDLNPTAAFMSGKLTVEGDMGLAMQLGAALA